MERYAEYKDSGLPWAGDIPTDWDIIPIKRIAKMKSGTTIASEKIGEYGDVPVFGGNGLRGYTSEYTHVGYFSIIGRQGALCGNVNYANGMFWATEHAVVVTPLKYQPTLWLGELLRTMDLGQYANSAAQPGLSVEVIEKKKAPYPPHEEQIAIAKYLDRRTSEIDSLLTDLQSQTDMLDRYKRELIANTITHGLDKNAATKDSGVDWIGDVPAHWQVTKTKWIFEVVKRIYGKEGRDVLSITNHGLKVRDIESNEGQLAESYANYQVVNVNDFAMNSMDLLTGWVDCSPFEGVTSPDYRVFRFHQSKPQCHNYYKYLFQMCYKCRIFYRLGQGVSNLGRWRLQADQFLNMKLPQPPVDEQEIIAAFLDKKTAQVDGLIADINEQIGKLKEYRQIVIHDAVTGKVKVTEG